MRPHAGRILSIALLSAAVAPPCRAQSNPDRAEETEIPLVGVVTRAASPGDFDVNGVQVLCGPHTITGPTEDKTTKWLGCPREAPFPGEVISAYGWPSHKHHSFAADRLLIGLDMPQELTGRAIVEQVQRQGSDGTMLRADGFMILLSPRTKMHFRAPLQSASDLAPDLWIAYKGKLRDDGVLIASEARFATSDVGEGEQNLIADSEKRVNPKHPPKFQPSPDAAMQARVRRIGDSLVPSFERPSPTSDPIWAPIRFEIIEGKNCQGMGVAANGAILICAWAVQRMQNDSQLAALLAFSVARIIEHQPWRLHRDTDVIDTATAAMSVAAALDPFLLPVAVGESHADREILLSALTAQAARVSLWLLHDAGYDIHQAPIAFWLIASKKPKALADIPIPAEASFLYMYLGLEWRKAPPAGFDPHSHN